MSEEDVRRRAAALEALQQKRAPLPPVRSFWERNGSRILLVAGIVLALALVARMAGALLHSSKSEMDRATEELRKGMR